jgi:hypothetical protein
MRLCWFLGRSRLVLSFPSLSCVCVNTAHGTVAAAGRIGGGSGSEGDRREGRRREAVARNTDRLVQIGFCYIMPLLPSHSLLIQALTPLWSTKTHVGLRYTLGAWARSCLLACTRCAANIPPSSEVTCTQVGANGKRRRGASKSSHVAKASGIPDQLVSP